MTWRPLTYADLPDCLELHPLAVGHELIGRQRAFRAWTSLLAHPSCNFAVIELNKPVAGKRIVGFGASAFVSPAFAQEEISTPQPGLNARIMASIDHGDSVVLSEAELRYANTYSGLHEVVLCATWKRNLISDLQIEEVKMHLAASYLELHAGYRMVAILVEATDQAELDHGRSTGVHRLVSNFEDYYKTHPGRWNRERGLFAVDQKSALSVAGSLSSILFHHQEPTLRFGKEDQQLLTAALRGLTDDELCVALNLQRSTIKKRWASVFERVEKIRPGLLPDFADDLDRRTRGRQKRHHVLGYLRRHPEELRPILTKKTAASHYRLPPGRMGDVLPAKS
jgi:hypothetical protein